VDADFLEESPGSIFRAEVCTGKNWLGYTGMEDGYSDPQAGGGDCGKGGAGKQYWATFLFIIPTGPEWAPSLLSCQWVWITTFLTTCLHNPNGITKLVTSGSESYK
jgi:hypothetical protein